MNPESPSYPDLTLNPKKPGVDLAEVMPPAVMELSSFLR
jgi:hypothetical protein